MQGEHAVYANKEWEVPEDAVFEEVQVLGTDQLIKPTANDAWRLEGEGANGDIVEYLHVEDDKMVHEMKQDVEPYLKRIREMEHAQGSNVGKNKAGDFYLAASVAPVVIHAWLNKRGLTMKDFKYEVVDNFLNDPDNSAFRVWKGKV